VAPHDKFQLARHELKLTVHCCKRSRQHNLLIVASENLFVVLGASHRRRACISFQHFMLKFIARADQQKTAAPKCAAKLIAKSRDMTGFDEWMCMRAGGTHLAPFCSAAAPADNAKRGVDHARRHHACA
jgi:hypothetical protein